MPEFFKLNSETEEKIVNRNERILADVKELKFNEPYTFQYKTNSHSIKISFFLDAIKYTDLEGNEAITTIGKYYEIEHFQYFIIEVPKDRLKINVKDGNENKEITIPLINVKVQCLLNINKITDTIMVTLISYGQSSGSLYLSNLTVCDSFVDTDKGWFSNSNPNGLNGKITQDKTYELVTGGEGDYLPLTGGTLTGPLIVDSDLTVTGSSSFNGVSEFNSDVRANSQIVINSTPPTLNSHAVRKDYVDNLVTPYYKQVILDSASGTPVQFYGPANGTQPIITITPKLTIIRIGDMIGISFKDSLYDPQDFSLGVRFLLDDFNLFADEGTIYRWQFTQAENIFRPIVASERGLLNFFGGAGYMNGNPPDYRPQYELEFTINAPNDNNYNLSYKLPYNNGQTRTLTNFTDFMYKTHWFPAMYRKDGVTPIVKP